MTRREIPGWFPWMDQRVFEHFLSHRAIAPFGDLLEIGAYLGKSAVLMGDHVRSNETFTVCDLFGDTESLDINARAEVQGSYRGLTRTRFEENYLTFHDQLPVILQESSQNISKKVDPQSLRFVHVDGSHLYENVAEDLQQSVEMLKTGGVIAVDDFRSAHTPGTALAVWESILRGQLRMIAITEQKAYLTKDEDVTQHQKHLETWLRDFNRLRWETMPLFDQHPRIIRIRPGD